MITIKTTDSNGVKRTLEGKVFGTELRIYRIYGDVSSTDGIIEACQQAAIDTGCEKVRLSV